MTSYKAYFAIEKQIKLVGYDVHRDELISLFTDNKKDSLKSLTEREYKEFLNWLNLRFQLREKKRWEGTAEDKMRKKLIQLFVHEMGYTIKELNGWCVKYGPFHKKLNDHSHNELVKLVTIAKEKVYPDYMKRVTR